MESGHLSAQVKDLREALKQLSETLAAAAAPKPVKREFTRVVGEVGVDTDRRVTELLNDGWEIVSDQMVISPELPVNGGRNSWSKITNTCLVREVPVDGPHPPAPSPNPAQAPGEGEKDSEADWRPVPPTSPSGPVDGPHPPAPDPKPAQAPEEEPRPAARVVTGALVMPPHQHTPKDPLYYQQFTQDELGRMQEMQREFERIHRAAQKRQWRENELVTGGVRRERVG